MSTRHVDLSRAEWRKSSYSGSNGGQCVEAATDLPGIVAVRDSKKPEDTTLVFSRESWRAFAAALKAGMSVEG